MALEARACVPAASAKSTVVLACSTADAAALPRVLKRLVDVGVRVDVCAGVELDARPLQRALARGGARTSYAIFRSRSLDGAQLDRLYRLACDAGIPSDRLAVLRFEPERPDELTGALLQRLTDHGVVASSGVPTPLSSEDVTEPVMILPRELVRVSPSERSDVLAMPTVERLLEEPARPRRSWAPLAIAGVALALVVMFASSWLLRIGDEATIATAGIVVPPSSSAAVLADATQGMPPHVAAALAARTISAHERLLVAEPGDVSMHRPVARKRCGELYLAGISDWRMPTRAELDRLARAEFFAKGTTWWVAGEERDRPRARWTGTQVEPVAPEARAAARTICVHGPV